MCFRAVIGTLDAMVRLQDIHHAEPDMDDVINWLNKTVQQNPNAVLSAGTNKNTSVLNTLELFGIKPNVVPVTPNPNSTQILTQLANSSIHSTS